MLENDRCVACVRNIAKVIDVLRWEVKGDKQAGRRNSLAAQAPSSTRRVLKKSIKVVDVVGCRCPR